MRDLTEYTKKDLIRELRDLRYQLVKFEKGQLPSYEYDNFITLQARIDMGNDILRELYRRGISKTDLKVYSAFWRQYRKCEKMLEKRLWG